MSDKVEVIILATDKASGTINGIGKEVGGLGKILGSVGAAAGIAMAAVGAAIAAGFAIAVKSSIEVNAQLETTTLQFETLMGDAEKAEEHVASLFEFAERTPFETGPIIDASLKLETFGGAALNTRDNLYLLGDAAAATNAPIDELGFWVGRLYANLQAGQPFGEAAMRLQELAVMSPQARQEMEKLQKSGADASVIFGVLQEDLGRFTGAMEKQAGTWEGMVSTIKDQLNLLVADAMKPFFKNAKQGLSELVKLLNDPDIVAGIKAMGAELGKVADLLADMTGGFIRFFAVLGQRSANAQMFDDLNLSLQETRDLTNEIAEKLGVGMFMNTEEDLAVQAAVREEIERRYAAELLFVDGLYARSEAEDWANDETRRTTEVTRQAATSIQNVTGDVLAWRIESTLMASAAEGLADKTTVFADKMGPLKQVMEDNAASMRASEQAATNLASAFAGLAGDYLTELPGAMEPIISITEDIAGSQSNLTVNTNAAKQAIFDQLVQMEASPEIIAAYGLAIGAMTREQAIAALAAAAVKVEIEALATAIAAGVPVEDAIADLDAFIKKIDDELIPAASDAAGEVPAHFQDMIGPVGATAIEIGTALTDGIVEGITTGTPAATGAADDAALEVIKSTKNVYGVQSPSTVFSEIGRDLIEGLSQGIATRAASLPGQMATLGSSIIDGIISGLRSAAGRAYAVVAEIIDGIRAAAGVAAGEGSPAVLFIPLGESIVQGVIEGIENEEDNALATLEALVGRLGDVSGLAGGFSGLFERRWMAPAQAGLDAINARLEEFAPTLDGLLEGLGMSVGQPGLMATLQRMATSAFSSDDQRHAATMALALLDERTNLMQQQASLQETLIAGENKLLMLETQRQELAFLQQQFDLLKLINDNGLDPQILSGMTFGLDADPADFMNAMIEAMSSLITATNAEIIGLNPTPVERSFFDKAANGYAGPQTVINIDATGAQAGTEQKIKQVVEQVMRDYGVRADIRMRTG